MEPSVLLLVEGRDDALMARWTLKAAQYPLGRLTIRSGGREVSDCIRAKETGGRSGPVCGAIDLDERSVPDAVARALGISWTTDGRGLCAIPAIEAWLFADDNLALSQGLFG